MVEAGPNALQVVVDDPIMGNRLAIDAATVRLVDTLIVRDGAAVSADADGNGAAGSFTLNR